MGSKRDKKKKLNKESSAKDKQKTSEKAAKKNNKKAGKSGIEVENINEILAELKQKQESEFKITEEANCAPPSRRVNSSFLSNPLNLNEIFLFGGEYYDGQKVHLYNHLFKYKIDKNEWSLITSPNSPAPRSSHQMVIAPNGKGYLMGGEFVSPNETNFFHYKDFWTFDTKDYSWEKLSLNPKLKKPSPRSGHRITLWKNYIVLFGGFYDVGNEVKYFDDLWIFDTTNHEWTKAEVQEPKPTSRSGFQFFTHQDTCILYGGYCKQVIKGEKAKGIVHSDVWSLKMNQNIKQIRWEKKKKGSGMVPSLRSGCTMIYHSKTRKGIMFGGVTDTNENEESIEGLCFNDMFQYNVDSNRWFPLTLKKSANIGKKRRRNKKKKIDDEGKNILLEQEKQAPMEELETIFDDVDDDEEEDEKSIEETPTLDSEPVAFPWPRFNAMMTVVKNQLFIFGGILETQKREYTLNDFWTIQLDKMHEWQNIVYDKIIDDTVPKTEDESSDDDSSDDDDDEEEDASEDESAPKKPVIPESVNPLSIPQPNETLRDFFSRSAQYWQLSAINDNLSTLTGKSLRKDAFVMARDSWNEWQPKLKEMAEFLAENEQAAENSSRANNPQAQSRNKR